VWRTLACGHVRIIYELNSNGTNGGQPGQQKHANVQNAKRKSNIILAMVSWRWIIES
jgi:hypothetical protein